MIAVGMEKGRSNHMASMKDISIACGVSVATVSKALNDHADIGEETKLHIRRVAKEMGYLPNLSARALKTKRTYNLGVLFADESQSGLTHDYFANVLDSFRLYAESRGYDITFLNCSKTRKNRLSYLEHSRYRGLDGIVIACIDFKDAEVIELLQSQLPVVTIDHVFSERITVASDNIRGMRDLLYYIYEMGHRRVAYIYGDDTSVTKDRLSSFYRAAEELGLKIPDSYVLPGAYRDMRKASCQTEHLLKQKERPTCIIYPDDFAAVGGINFLKSKGLRIPEDISVAGYDGLNIASQFEPILTTIRQDTKTIGTTAAKKLIELIEHPKTTLIELITVPGELECGGTVGKI